MSPKTFLRTLALVSGAMFAVGITGCKSGSNSIQLPGTGGGGTGGGNSTAGSGGQAPSGSGGSAGAGGVAGSGGTGVTGGGGAAGNGGSGGASGSDGGMPDAAGPDTGHAGDGGVPDASLEVGPMLSAGPCSPPVDVDKPIMNLADTGCMDIANPTKFAGFVHTYDVNSPLWSDSADKARAFVLPMGGKIHVKDCAKTPSECSQGTADSGKWVFPVGTVMLKTFIFDGKAVETRLFVRHDAKTWVGYGYRWNEAQTEATVAPELRTSLMFNTGTRMVPWTYPSRIDCMTCHNDQGGSTLGPENAQLNRTMNGGTGNQIDNFAGMGLFDANPSKPYKALPTPYMSQVGPATTGATLDQKARSYMHANCGFCHRPDGDFTSLDLRYDVALKDTGLCKVAPTKSTLGIDGALLLIPQHKETSIVWVRLQSTDPSLRMPRIGTTQFDNMAISLIGDWINMMASPDCPM